MNETINVAFIGNPNCGKTTLFNAYTGAKLKVANWPGVTVEKKEGAMRYHDNNFKLVDLPGIYSLTSYTMEEKLSRKYILDDEVDIVVDIADASSLEKNLYLTLQLIELGKPVILALNMMDIVEERGMDIDLHRLPEMLGIPVIPVSARKKRGLDVLIHAVAHHNNENKENILKQHRIEKENSKYRHKHDHHNEYAVVYSDEIEDKIDIISDRLILEYPEIENVRWHAIKILEMDEEVKSKYPIDFSDVVDKNYESQIVNEKYDFIEEIINECVVNKDSKAEKTDKIDKILTNRYLGIPIFLGIMALVFFLTFTVGDFLKGGFEIGLEWFTQTVASFLEGVHANEIVTSLILDGIIAGVGGILTFLPNIFILFLALAFLEDSGYMSRVAYVMDGLMGKIGLSGRAFIPLLLGFGCTVPAVMASRALEDKRDRLKTILITPFMSCSARLPIYVLFSELFFQKHAMLVAYSMYIIGLIVAILVALVINKIDKKKNKEVNTLLIELPEYKSPNARTISIYVWEKVKDYLSKAGTTIFVASIIIWGLLNFGPTGKVADMGESFGAIIGKSAIWLFEPAGLGYWQIIVALISGIAAKEVVVSSMSVLYGISNINSTQGMASILSIFSSEGFGPLNAYSLMVFCLLYIPCIATIATIKKETNSNKWMIFSIVFQLVVAWVISTLVYQIGSLI
ncbi:MAG: ferrous iron transport protein B [Clostridiales bacterium]|nr:ferrous iron transport protein B [Clostridiales bacterium]